MNMMLTPTLPTATPIAELHDEFLRLLPRMLAVLKFAFRHHHDQVDLEDRLAEAVALCWKWFRRLDQLGQRHRAFPTALAGFAAKQVRSGRGVVGQRRAKDAMNIHAQRRFGFRVRTMPSVRRCYATHHDKPSGQRHLDVFEEQLTHNTVTAVDEQVAFRLDFNDWLATLTDRDRRIIGDMGRGDRTTDLADRYGLSPARISQKRQEFHHGWHCFTAAENQVVNVNT